MFYLLDGDVARSHCKPSAIFLQFVIILYAYRQNQPSWLTDCAELAVHTLTQRLNENRMNAQVSKVRRELAAVRRAIQQVVSLLALESCAWNAIDLSGSNEWQCSVVKINGTAVCRARCHFNWSIIAVIRNDMREFVVAAVISTLKR